MRYEKLISSKKRRAGISPPFLSDLLGGNLMSISFGPERWGQVRDTYAGWWSRTLERPVVNLTLTGANTGKPANTDLSANTDL